MENRSFQGLFNSDAFYKLDNFCDVTIVTEDGAEFRAHKLFLSKSSEYFKALFKTEVGIQSNVTVFPFDKNILEIILIYIYTGEVHLNDENIVSLILASDYLLIDPLLRHCKYFVKSRLSLKNCVSLLSISYLIEKLKITADCYRFVQIHFETLVNDYSYDIPKLPVQAIKKLLNDDSLGITDEETVWKAVVSWVTGSSTDKEKYVPELLSSIRWSDVDYCLASNISSHPIVQGNPLCKIADLVKPTKASKEQFLESDRLKLSTNRCPSKMYVFIRKKPFPHSRETEVFLTYDNQLDIWRKIGEIHTFFQTLVATDKYIFIFNAITNAMQTFDLQEKEWVEKSQRRTRQGYIAQSGNRIFAVGGYTLTSVPQYLAIEYYDPTTDIWSLMKPLPPMHVTGVAVVNELLYVVGYLEHADRLEMKVLVHDAVCDVWSDIEKPNLFRTNFALINFNDRLYILGGETEDGSVTASVEAYDSKTEKWEECPKLPIFYDMPRAVVLNDQLVIYSDSPVGMSFPRCPACVWNAEIGQWKVEAVFSPFSEIHLYEFCSIQDQSTVRELTRENRGSQAAWMKTPFKRN